MDVDFVLFSLWNSQCRISLQIFNGQNQNSETLTVSAHDYKKIIPNFTYFLPILRWCRPSQFCLGAYWEPAHLQQISEVNIMYLHISEVGVIFVGRKLLQTEFVGFIRWWNSCSLSHISGSKFWTSTLAVLCPFCASLLEPAPAIWAQESHWCKKEIM